MPRVSSKASPKKYENKVSMDIEVVSQTSSLDEPLIMKSEPSCSVCGRKNKESPIHTCCVCGNIMCETCVFKGLMFRRMSGWKCAGCVGTPSKKMQNRK